MSISATDRRTNRRTDNKRWQYRAQHCVVYMHRAVITIVKVGMDGGYSKSKGWFEITAKAVQPIHDREQYSYCTFYRQC